VNRKSSRNPRRSGPRGLFISFEGIDGSGKSTQLRKAARYLRALGKTVVTVREPGSTRLSEGIRRLLLRKGATIDPTAELLLYIAARAQLVSERIRPALTQGAIVLCDRFHDSTVAYQGFGRGLEFSKIELLRRIAVGDTMPDHTFIYDIDPSGSLARRKKNSDRLESEENRFFTKVARGFRAIAQAERERASLIDARRPIEAVWADTKAALDALVAQ